MPDQSPVAVQLTALLLCQFSVVEPLIGILVGSADKLTDNVGGAATVTLTEFLVTALPPEHDRLKVLLIVRELMVSDPEVGLVPVQSPVAVQLSAFVLLQFRMVEPL